jgi:amino acid adenylation domain-containing protein
MTVRFERTEIESSVGARLRSLAVQIPRQEAVRSGSTAVTFSELDSTSDRIARFLQTRLGPDPQPVALLLEQSIPGLMATFGVLKAGKSFSILPPEFPPDRLNAMWADLQKPALISNSNQHALALAISKDPALVLDIDAASSFADSPPLPDVPPDALGAIFYTSATTGDPKGVMWPHRMILHTAWQNGDLYRLSPRDRLAHFSAYGFGAAATASFAAILNGATLTLRTEKNNDLRAIVGWLKKNKIAVLSLTSFGPFRQQAAAEKFSRSSLPDLRIVLLGGEDLYRPDLDAFWNVFPDPTSLAYRLAGSETMLMRELRIEHGTSIPDGKIPVGYAVPDKELLLLDENHHPVPDGQIGEIAIRTRYLASGYWRKPELYAERFQSDPVHPEIKTYRSGDIGRLTPEGQLEYLGRKDNVIKIRGFSIQLEDVERAIQSIAGVKECSAAGLALPSGDKRLAAYIVAEPGASLAVEDLRRQLANTLPRFMIPGVFIFLDRLPRTPTGKVEHSKLPTPGSIRPPLRTPYVPPHSEMEKKLCALWSELLHIDTVGIDDDFFDLGGDSLLTLHLAFRIEEEFGRQIPKPFFTRPTVAALAGLWETGVLTDEIKNAIPSRAVAGRNRKRLKKMPGRALPAFQVSHRPSREENIRRDPAEAARLLFRTFIAAIAVQLPYPEGSRWAAWFPFQPWARKLFFQPQMDLYRRFIADIGGSDAASEFALEINIAGNILWSGFAKRGINRARGRNFIDQLRGSRTRYWSDFARIVEQGSDDSFQRFFSVSGFSHLQEALSKGRGVILATYHNTANRIAVAALPRILNCEPIPTISINRAIQLENKRMQEDQDEFPSAAEEALMANLTLEGKRLLEEGRIIQIVPDTTFDVEGNRPLVIGGRTFQIKPGIAEYALLTGAAIIPQYSTRRLDGSIHMAFSPPIQISTGAADRGGQIYSILQQYAAFVDRSWRLAPESLKWSTLSKLFRKPRALRPAAAPAEGGEDPS